MLSLYCYQNSLKYLRTVQCRHKRRCLFSQDRYSRVCTSDNTVNKGKKLKIRILYILTGTQILLF